MTVTPRKTKDELISPSFLLPRVCLTLTYFNIGSYSTCVPTSAPPACRAIAERVGLMPVLGGLIVQSRHLPFS